MTHRSSVLSTIVLGFSYLVTAAAAPAGAQGRLGEDFEPKLLPIVDGVYAYEGPLVLEGEEEIVRTNSLVVVTEEGVVVVDGQDTLEDAEHLVRSIGEVTDRPIRYLINASHHPDHVNGNAAFEGAVIIAHEAAKRTMVERERESGTSIPLPSMTYADQMTLDVGGTVLELYFFGPAHTNGDTIVYLPEEKVAFLTEVYFNGVFTSVSDGFARSHLDVLARIKELDAEWFIPGHGIIENQTAEQLREGLDRYEANVRVLHDAVAAHVEAGHSLEQTMEAMDEELAEFKDLPFYDFLLPRSVQATYQALSEKE